MDAQRTVSDRRPRAVFLTMISGLAAFSFLVQPAFPAESPAGAGRPSAVEPQAISPAATPPVIDGRLNDPIWEQAAKFDGFKTFEPDFKKEPSQKTECFVSYDADNFYFAFRCYDTEPGRIKAAVSKRDDVFQDDIAGVILDTFNDMQSGFGFIVNPLGIQGDGLLDFNGNMQDNHDMVWFSKGVIDDEGWTAEIQVPLKSIRFPNKPILTMRVIFIRFFTRTSEQASFPALDPEGGSIMGQSHPIQISGLKYSRVVEILPAFTYDLDYAAEGGEMVKSDEDRRFLNLMSLTGKFGVTSDLTLDGTYNPDFSQVEADAGQIDVNLRYALYYPEKRPFFLEGNDMWRFGGEQEDAPLAEMVYTRRIVDPDYGFRLTGKVAGRDSIAAIYSHDYRPGDETDDNPDFTILRYRHSLKEDSFIGGFYTGREYSGGFNRVGGLDGRFRLSPTSVASFHFFGSWTRPGEGEALNKDHALSATYSFQNRKWIVELGYQDVSQNFQVDSGFVFRTGLRRIGAFGMYQIYPKSKFFQKIEPFYWSYHLYDTFDKMWETVNVFVARFRLPRNTQVRFDGRLIKEVFAGQQFDGSGFGIRTESQILKQLFFNASYFRTGMTYYDPDDPYQGYGSRLSAGAQYQPTENLSFVLSLSYSDFYRKSDHEKIYDYTILRSRNIFQINKYLFLRAILEYNFYRERLTTDLLASFTYIPGTVVHVGYGSAYERLAWDGQDYVASDNFLETRRGFFFKVSYLWRL